MKSLDELVSWMNKTYPDRNWDQQCQRLMWNAVYFLKGYTNDNQVVTYPTAQAAREASNIISTDPNAAPVGAMHWWRNPIGDGHVGLGLGGARVLMTGTPAALGSGGVQRGTNYGVTTVQAYTSARGNPYLGWSHTNGRNPSLEGLLSTGTTPAQAKPAAPAEKKTVAAVLTEYGFKNVADIVRAMQRTGIPTYIAAAFIEKESGGANVFGHDTGGAYYGAGEVTEAKYKAFRSEVKAGKTSNGVGVMQVTWPGFFDQAEKKGLSLWKPYDNAVFGFGLAMDYLNGDYSTESIKRAGARYNGNSSYGDDLAAKASVWYQRLKNTTFEGELSMADINSIDKQLKDIRNQFKNMQVVPFLQIRNKKTGMIYVWNPYTGDRWVLPNVAYRNLWVARGLLSDDVIDIDPNEVDHFFQVSGQIGNDPVEKRISALEAKIDKILANK